MEIRTAFDRACSSYARPPNSWIDADAARAHITAASIRAAWISVVCGANITATEDAER